LLLLHRYLLPPLSFPCVLLPTNKRLVSACCCLPAIRHLAPPLHAPLGSRLTCLPFLRTWNRCCCCCSRIAGRHLINERCRCATLVLMVNAWLPPLSARASFFTYGFPLRRFVFLVLAPYGFVSAGLPSHAPRAATAVSCNLVLCHVLLLCLLFWDPAFSGSLPPVSATWDHLHSWVLRASPAGTLLPLPACHLLPATASCSPGCHWMPLLPACCHLQVRACLGWVSCLGLCLPACLLTIPAAVSCLEFSGYRRRLRSARLLLRFQIMGFLHRRLPQILPGHLPAAPFCRQDLLGVGFLLPATYLPRILCRCRLGAPYLPAVYVPPPARFFRTNRSPRYLARVGSILLIIYALAAVFCLPGWGGGGGGGFYLPLEPEQTLRAPAYHFCFLTEVCCLPASLPRGLGTSTLPPAGCGLPALLDWNLALERLPPGLPPRATCRCLTASIVPVMQHACCYAPFNRAIYFIRLALRVLPPAATPSIAGLLGLHCSRSGACILLAACGSSGLPLTLPGCCVCLLVCTPRLPGGFMDMLGGFCLLPCRSAPAVSAASCCPHCWVTRRLMVAASRFNHLLPTVAWDYLYAWTPAHLLRWVHRLPAFLCRYLLVQGRVYQVPAAFAPIRRLPFCLLPRLPLCLLMPPPAMGAAGPYHRLEPPLLEQGARGLPTLPRTERRGRTPAAGFVARLRRLPPHLPFGCRRVLGSCLPAAGLLPPLAILPLRWDASAISCIPNRL